LCFQKATITQVAALSYLFNIASSSTATYNEKMATQTKYLKAGDRLFQDGQPSDSMYLIQKGTVSIQKGSDEGALEISKVYANEVIGELSFFDRRPRSASAIAITDVEVIEIDFGALDKVYTNIPPYLKTIMSSVAERLRKTTEQLRKTEKRLSKYEDLSQAKDD
jgi:CRP-like cAMP-binding protein